MENQNRWYIAIDLKSFYASVECVERKLDPLTTNLVVADSSRTEKTICLAVTPSLKAYGVGGRARLFEVVAMVKEVNKQRLANSPEGQFKGKSENSIILEKHPELELSYIAAPPRMALYVEYSTKIYEIYLRYIAPEDIHVYSIDEVFMDVTDYLKIYQMSVEELARKMIQDVLMETGITATAGIGTNLYLAKVAMDVVAKHTKADENGVRIAQLDERSYRKKLWNHTKLTDFWRVGKGYEKKLRQVGLYTMGDIARCSIGKETEFYNEDLLYKLFGVNAELLIDHAWGYEPTRICDIKAYKPESNSISSGQVLSVPYDFNKARLIVKEMTELLALDLVAKRLYCDQVVLHIGYDRECLEDPERAKLYVGEITKDAYGRPVPKPAHKSANLSKPTSSTRMIMEAMLGLYDEIVHPQMLVRRLNVVANHVIPEEKAQVEVEYEQLSLFQEPGQMERNEEERQRMEKERKLQEAMLSVKKRYGKNAMLKGMNLEEGATTIERNGQIGGHKA